MEDGKTINHITFTGDFYGSSVATGEAATINMGALKSVMRAIAHRASNKAYPKEVTDDIINSYIDNPSKETVIMLAKKYDKAKNLIVDKLKRSGVYNYHKKAEKRNESDAPVLRKAKPFKG